MKINVFLVFVAFLTVFASCKKEEVNPVANPSTVNPSYSVVDIQVEYKIYAASGNFKVKYKTPNAGGTALVENIETINRLQHSIVFDYKSGNKFKVEAYNSTPSTDEVIVEVYINGNLYQTGTANSPNAVAVAEAMVY